MVQLIYSSMMSLDGFTADESGNFDWAAPDEAVHAFVNDMERPIGTYLYGRRMYEVMSAWALPATVQGEGPVMHDYATIWQAADKVVFSTTLATPSTDRTTIERFFDPEMVRELKRAADRDISVGGPEIAGQMLRAGLIDQVNFYISPVIVGGGTRALPAAFRDPLVLIDQRAFDNGVVYVSYRTS